MDFDTFDTDLWSEIQDAPGEIFDIDEAKEDEQTWNDFVNSNVTVWQVAQGVLCSHQIPAIIHLLRGKTKDGSQPLRQLEAETYGWGKNNYRALLTFNHRHTSWLKPILLLSKFLIFCKHIVIV